MSIEDAWTEIIYLKFSLVPGTIRMNQGLDVRKIGCIVGDIFAPERPRVNLKR